MVLVFAESPDGKIKKASFEAVTYGKKIASLLGCDCAALIIGQADGSDQLGLYGADKVIQVSNTILDNFDSQTYTATIAQVANNIGAQTIVVGHSSTGRSLVGRLAAKLEAAVISGAKTVPTNDGGFKVAKNVFSGKAIAEFTLNTPMKVISLMGNSIQPEEIGSTVAIEQMDVQVNPGRVTVRERKTVSGTVPLPEAELVVSAGRGMGGPEKWQIIDDLANSLGATTACSRPVADTGWRPHHEHVGQTGVAIRPNLYIAIGISGAIQHLAGVSSSKTIVVINKDAEAPFFKNADYGIVADLFDVVPKLTEAIKEYNSINA